MMNRHFLLICSMIALAGCAQTQFKNHPLTANTDNVERREIEVSDKDQPVILMALSGGGARAADLGYVILRELKNYTYKSQRGSRRLADDVAIISSVSGGSVIAAYFGLYGPDRLEQFETDFLVRHNMGELTSDLLNPLNWFRLSSRVELVEDMFKQRLFQDRTFVELNRPGKPFVILNTTDMATGEVFAFTPERFDDICSDFDKLEIATGVAASTAVPVVLTPVPFKNYSTSYCQERPTPSWLKNKVYNKNSAYTDIEQYKRARYAYDLRNAKNLPNAEKLDRNIQYLYLVDGGLADNLGIHSLLEELSVRGTGHLLDRILEGKIRKLVVLVVNARSDAPNKIYESPELPSEWDMIKSVTSVPIDSMTASVNSQMQERLTQIRKEADNAPADAKFRGMKVYSIQIDFDQLKDNNKDQKHLRSNAKSIPTSWNISAEDRDVISEVGKLLLQQHPDFQKLLKDMKIDTPN